MSITSKSEDKNLLNSLTKQKFSLWIETWNIFHIRTESSNIRERLIFYHGKAALSCYWFSSCNWFQVTIPFVICRFIWLARLNGQQHTQWEGYLFMEYLLYLSEVNYYSWGKNNHSLAQCSYSCAMHAKVNQT